MSRRVSFELYRNDVSMLSLRHKLTSIYKRLGYSTFDQDYLMVNGGELVSALIELTSHLTLHVAINEDMVSIEGQLALPNETASLLSKLRLNLNVYSDSFVWSLPTQSRLSIEEMDNLCSLVKVKTSEELMAELKDRNLELAAHRDGLEKEIESRTHDLRMSEELSRTIIDGAPSSVAIIDSIGRILLWNKTAVEVYGYSVEEALGQNLISLLKMDLPEELEAIFSKPLMIEDHQLVAGGFFELDSYTRRDLTIPIDLGISIFQLNERCQAAMFLRDVSSRKFVEDQLNEARDRAEEAVEVKSMFLANMSHEIRTPMNAIIGMSHLALKTDLSVKQHDYVSKINTSATLLLGIINDILDFSKIEAGKLSIESIEFSLDDVLRNVSMVTGQKAFEKGLELLFSLPRNTADKFYGDPLRLGQVIINLVNNSVKFTESGEISVSVKSLQQQDSRIELQFSVVDTGIGMSNEQISNLFKAFTQADGSTTRKYGGTGLGLSISRRLVELMGGELKVESSLGEGSCFTFNIWLEAGESPELPHALVPSSLGKLKVLVVDDNEHALMIMQDMLNILPQGVELACSGRQAIEKLEHAAAIGDPFNLVFMDWNMPEMDGVETSLKIRRVISEQAQPKIVIVTAYDKEEIADTYDSIGVAGYLSKPVGQSYLFDILVKLFSDEPWKEISRHSKSKPRDATIFNGLKVLLTEDNEINQQIAMELMEAEGMLVTVANNGLEALEQLKLSLDRQERFDMIFMDLQMPVMDGYEASKNIRNNPEHSDTPLIAMTAHAMVEERERCLNIGMNDHVSKPIDPDHLFNTIQKWSGRSPADNEDHTISSSSPGGEPLAPDWRHATESKQNQPSCADKKECLDLSDVLSLDYKNGLLRVAGNKELYRRLLSQFIDREYNVVERCQIALEKKDIALAILHAHTLKGASANLGVVRLSDIAARLENDLQSAELSNTVAFIENKQDLLNEAQQCIDSLFKDIAMALNRPPPCSNRDSDLDPELVAVTHQLYVLLHELNSEAIDFLEEHYLQLKTILTTEDFEVCCRYINDCDFEQASTALRKAVSIYPFDLEKIEGERGSRGLDE